MAQSKEDACNCIDDTRDGSHAGSQTLAFWVIQALYAMSEEDNIKEIQASHLALGRESSTVQEEVRDNSNEKTKQPCSKALQEEKGQDYLDNLTKARQSHSTFK